MKTRILFSSLFMLFFSTNLFAQLPCLNTPSTIIYIHSGSSIYNYDVTQPISASNPVLNTITMPSGGGGLAVSNNLNGPGPSPTFYTTISGIYWYYDGTTWVNTGHSCGGTAAVNSGGGGNYLYNLIGASGQVWKYDGTGPATLLITVPGFTGGGPYDLVGNCDGSFYILRTLAPGQWMQQIDPNGLTLNTWTNTGPSSSAGGGFAIIGDTVYYHNTSGFCSGFMNNTTNTINFSVQPITIPSPSDMAVCPVCQPSGPIPNFNFSEDTICVGSCIDLINLCGNNPLTYNWTIPGGNPSSSTLASPTGVCFNTPGNFDVKLVVTNASGIDSITKTLIVLPIPTATITGDMEICYGESTTLQGGPGGVNYLWSEAAQSSSSIIVSPQVNTTYSLIVNQGICYDSTTATVIVNPLPEVAATSTLTNCDANTGTATAVGNLGTTPYSYAWSNGDNINMASLLGVGTYTVTLTDSKGCTATTTVGVGMHSNPIASINPYPSADIKVGDKIVLTATGGSSYLWSPSTYLSCYNCATTVATPKFDFVYCVEARNEFGCTDTACVTIFVDTSCANIYLPTAFSPNNDGLNDVIHFQNPCITDMKFMIFNRWGQKVYESKGQEAKWDGTFKGEPQPISTYFYVLEATFTNGRIVKKRGDITLVR